MSEASVHLNLDDAWSALIASSRHAPRAVADGTRSVPATTIDLRHWGPKLRYHGKRNEVENFYQEICGQLTPFALYGSGDFHYLAAVLLRRITEAVTVISFDNHPDWDIRPPYWSCGGWVNRALERPNVQRVVVWGCGNFELQMPSRLFANRKALRSGRLQVRAWAERQPLGVRRRFDCMTRESWKDRFKGFSQSLSGQNVYVTIDLDCLAAEEAVTNWEAGLFKVDDLVWALETLRSNVNIAGGDLCGGYSKPRYERWFQHFAGNCDHPKMTDANLSRAKEINLSALYRIWPALSSPPAQSHR
jgi:hypothetical protein